MFRFPGLPAQELKCTMSTTAKPSPFEQVLNCHFVIATAWRCACVRILVLSAIFLLPAKAGAQQEQCASANDLYKFVSQFEVTSDADKLHQTTFLLALRNVAEVHAKLIVATEVKPPLLICLSPDVNAKVYERGHPIFVMTGFLDRFGHDKDVLAAMLAHELGHLERDHAGYRKRAEGVFRYNAQLAGRSAFWRTNRYEQARRASTIEYYRQHFAFSREQEADADDQGAIILSRAGFRPDAAIKALTSMLALRGYQATAWYHEHPGLLDRILLVQPRVFDLESDQLARSLSEQGDRAALARQINAWLKNLPDSGNAWFHKAVFLEKLRSIRGLEAYERSLGANGPSISRADEELAEVWLALCVGLYKADFKAESASCSLRLRYSDLREQYRAATFGDNLVVGGEAPASDLLLARDEDGRKIITNDSTTLTRRGLPATHKPASWRPIRFPPTEVDHPLSER